MANGGYWGIPVQPKTTYRASILGTGGSNFSGPVTVSIVSDDGSTVYASGKFSGLTTGLEKFEVTLKTGQVTPTAKAHFAITLDQPGTVWLGLVSLVPADMERPAERFSQGPDANAGGFASEVPAFSRRQLCRRRHCRDAIRLEENASARLRSVTAIRVPGVIARPTAWGLLEFLEWCEDMKAEPVLAVYAGYSLKGTHVNPGPDLEPFVQDALDEIEYVTGDTNTTWGAQRAQDGHPGAVQLALCRNRQRGLVRQIRELRRAVRAIL